jgi:asparagine synthase (glutamine-hydrolysing)
VTWALAGGEKTVLREALRGVLPDAVRLRKKSSLPKDQSSGPKYLAMYRDLRPHLHPLVTHYVDLAQLDARCIGDLEETMRAVLFRVIALHHWATHYEVSR